MIKKIREDYTHMYTQTKLNITVKKRSLKLLFSLCSFADLLLFLNKGITFLLFFYIFSHSLDAEVEVWCCAKTARRLLNEASRNRGQPSLPVHY